MQYFKVESTWIKEGDLSASLVTRYGQGEYVTEREATEEELEIIKDELQSEEWYCLSENGAVYFKAEDILNAELIGG